METRKCKVCGEVKPINELVDEMLKAFTALSKNAEIDSNLKRGEA